LLLLVIAVAALLTGKQSVVVNPRTRSITVENSGPLGTKNGSFCSATSPTFALATRVNDRTLYSGTFWC
jgi:hypothetical protein